MRSNTIFFSFAAAFAAFVQLAAVFAAFAVSVPAIADQPMGTVSVTQEQRVYEVAEVIVEVRRAI